ncbi:MAG: aminoglycoside 3'-phosphotransferase [Ruminococcus sp.]|nr:aminoglycoside 3'-phosphotransferase [Ruminococcus sp.]
MLENIPENIRHYIEGKPYKTESIGFSDSEVYVFDDMVLKIEPMKEWIFAMISVMCTLEGVLPLPHMIYHGVCEGRSYLLTERAKGVMACDEFYMTHPDLLLPVLADSLHKLWSVDVRLCPRERGLDTELAEARERIQAGLVDLSDSDCGFGTPYELLYWLEQNKPEPELCVSHGDLCLPNIFINGDKLSALIDIGDMGVADKWRDISLLYRSLKQNADGTFGKVYKGIDPEKLFDYIGIKKDEKKLRYYLLLDELFG